jgi:transglutaminase-like putative cysteine protease
LHVRRRSIPAPLRTLAATTLPAVAITASWLRLEEPRRSGEALAAVALALAPALPPRGWQRALAAVGAALGASWIALGAQPWELVPFRDERVLGPAATTARLGIEDFYGVVLPFVPARHPEMHGVVLLAVFGFVCMIGLLVAARQAVPAAAVTVVGAGWPATLVGGEGVAVGGLALAAALSIPLVLRTRSGPSLVTGAAATAVVVVVAVWASSASTFARSAVVDWQAWDFRGVPARALGVRFVWDGSYDGIRFPPTKTVVLEISGPTRPQYWRAAALDLFEGDRWVEDVSLVSLGSVSGRLPGDRLTPARAFDEDEWLEHRVRVEALVDARLVAAGTPVAVDAPSLGALYVHAGSVLRARQAIEDGSRYRTWSYVANPSPAALAQAGSRYPAATAAFLRVWGQALPAFGAPRRDAQVRALFAAASEHPRHFGLVPYRPLYEEARRVVGSVESQYEAVLALEAWFRRSGGFRYEEQPPRAIDSPPLVHFALESRAGYCQHFAGAMAVMLRLLGIPSRVAVGFTSGTYADGVWTVTDHNAHAWVEVWFPGEGWVTFDPTPGRGRFSGTYSYASESAAAVAALERGELRDASAPTRGRGGAGSDLLVPSGSDDRPSLVPVVILLAFAGAMLVGLAKLAWRRARYLTRDPRRLAAASRKELEEFLRDQGISVSRSATLDDLRRALADELGVDGSAFASAAGRGRFGPASGAPWSSRLARRELRAALARARSGLSVWSRVRGFVSLRSVRSGWQG